MTLLEYQSEACTTAIYPEIGHRCIYPVLGLANETGEVVGKIKKVFRDNGGNFTPQDITDIKFELGDTLWYLSQVCSTIGISLDDVAFCNIQKLKRRQHLNTLQGSGDKR